MCGICGIIGVNDNESVRKMCNGLMHRGPDSNGFFFSTEDKIGLGMRRLRIIDLNTGEQPIQNENGDIEVVYNGEIYNFKILRKELINNGHKFYTKTDTEVIVHLYEEYGTECVKHLEGMFSFALWDKNKKKLLIARDPIGIKPLYYCFKNGILYFASELKVIFDNKDICREIDLEALNYYLTFLYIPSPLSIFKEIRKLPAGHFIAYQQGHMKIEKYWDLHIDNKIRLEKNDLKEKLYALLEDTVKKHLVSDVPLGVFLSGGMDSSSIVGLMSKAGCGRIKTFSIGYGDENMSFNELGYSRKVAEYFGTEHQEYITNPDVMELVKKLVWYLDEPFADSSAVPTYLVSQMARRNVTVALSGIGGDECFGGYPRYIGADISEKYCHMPVIFKKAVANFMSIFPETTKSRDIANWAKRFTQGAMLPEIERYIFWISFLKKQQAKEIFSPGIFDVLKEKDSHKIHKKYYSRLDNGTYLDKIFYLDVKTYLVDDLLMMGDKMSMANSLELRVPFCDHSLLEFSASIPCDTKLRKYRLKSLFKEVMAECLPREIINRKKQGFMMPIGSWLKNELKELTLELLSEHSINKRGYFNYGHIKKILNEHYEGRVNHSDQIWSFIILELWFQAYVDR